MPFDRLCYCEGVFPAHQVCGCAVSYYGTGYFSSSPHSIYTPDIEELPEDVDNRIQVARNYNHAVAEGSYVNLPTEFDVTGEW